MLAICHTHVRGGGGGRLKYSLIALAILTSSAFGAVEGSYFEGNDGTLDKPAIWDMDGKVSKLSNQNYQSYKDKIIGNNQEKFNFFYKNGIYFDIENSTSTKNIKNKTFTIKNLEDTENTKAITLGIVQQSPNANINNINLNIENSKLNKVDLVNYSEGDIVNNTINISDSEFKDNRIFVLLTSKKEAVKDNTVNITNTIAETRGVLAVGTSGVEDGYTAKPFEGNTLNLNKVKFTTTKPSNPENDDEYDISLFFTNDTSNSNNMTINDSKLTAATSIDLIGTEHGNISKAKLDISNSNIKANEDIYAISTKKNALNNKVNISGSTLQSDKFLSILTPELKKVSDEGKEFYEPVEGGDYKGNVIDISNSKILSNVSVVLLGTSGLLSNNTIKLKDSNITSKTGGIVLAATVGNNKNNILNIDSSNLESSKSEISIGYSDEGNISNSTINISNSKLKSINGLEFLVADNKISSNNKLTISNSSLELDHVDHNIKFSHGNKGALGNKISIENSKLKAFGIYGGSAAIGDLKGNTIHIKDSDIQTQTLTAVAVAGEDFIDKNIVIENNKLILEDSGSGKFKYVKLNSDNDYYKGAITAVHIDAWGQNIPAEKYKVNIGTGNKVVLKGNGLSVNSELLGYHNPEYSAKKVEIVSNNTSLDIMGKNIKAQNVANFKNYNFYLGKDVVNNDKLLILTTKEDTNISGSNINILVEKGNEPDIKKDNKLTLISKKDGKLKADKITTNTVSTDDPFVIITQKFNSPVVEANRNLVITANGNLIAVAPTPDPDQPNPNNPSVPTPPKPNNPSKPGTTPNKKVSPASYSILSTPTAGLALNSKLSNTLMDRAFIDIEQRITDNEGIIPFAYLNGYKLNQSAGDVDTKGLTLTAGIAKAKDNYLVGAFFEYGYGDYDGNINKTKSDGKVNAYGGGVLARVYMDNNIYMDGFAKAGRMKNKYDAKMDIVGSKDVSYKYNSTYYGVGIGAGYKTTLNNNIELNNRLGYVYGYIDGGNAKVLDANYKINSITSHRAKFDSRLAYINTAFKPFIDLKLEYEFAGKAKANVKDGISLKNSGFSGGAGVGFIYNPTSLTTFDFGVYQMLGERKETGLNLGVEFKF
ncbi:autotransporter outer membrane beta-barrel domain-containing protein [Campylobacter blaseri]|uniref:Autotransporter domain-containing protein n=1 Tax=Campylobacter blaseri TaxID=2042961 RepID=A0A2P8QZB0_9BACT|nr:autotransporter outer membrane beta-barrel domain-containing protein [Campylobacter blaseri]PSM51571.1 hypothetical protein CQ405_07185 [Campylobacter blaseri]